MAGANSPRPPPCPLGYLDDFDDARRVYLGAKLLLQAFTPVPRAELRLPEVRRPTR
jgi:hypothetical protein